MREKYVVHVYVSFTWFTLQSHKYGSRSFKSRPLLCVTDPLLHELQ